MTEEDVRRIFREELERVFSVRRENVALQAGPNYLTQPPPMPRYDFQRPYYPGGPWPVTCGQGVSADPLS